MPSKPMIERARRGPYDELRTPPEAIEPLIPVIPKDWVIWEPALGCGDLVLAFDDWETIITTEDFFEIAWAEGADVMITNPPFSKKVAWLEKCRQVARPFALLLPITTLGVRAAHDSLRDIEILFLKRRVDFTGKGAPWFSVAWFTWGFNIGKQLTFPDG